MQRLIDAGHRVFLEIGAHPVLRRDIAACLSEKSLQGATLGSLRRADRERAALLGSLGRLYSLGAEIDWRKLYPADATAIKLPAYPFQAESHWRESDQNRRLRVGRPAHPLLGIRLEVATPSWKGDLGSVALSYLADHRISDSVVFPGAGYVEMGLAAAREIFGPVPCVLEDVEFQRIPVSRRGACARAAGEARHGVERVLRLCPHRGFRQFLGRARPWMRQAGAHSGRADRRYRGNSSTSSRAARWGRMPASICGRRIPLWSDVPGSHAAMARRSRDRRRGAGPGDPAQEPARLSAASRGPRRLLPNHVAGVSDLDRRAECERRNLRAGEDRARPLQRSASNPHFRLHPGDRSQLQGAEGRSASPGRGRRCPGRGAGPDRAAERPPRAANEWHALRISMEAQSSSDQRRRAGFASPPVAGGSGSHLAARGRGSAPAIRSDAVSERIPAPVAVDNRRLHCPRLAAAGLDAGGQRGGAAGGRARPSAGHCSELPPLARPDAEGADPRRHCFDRRPRSSLEDVVGRVSGVPGRAQALATLRREPAGGAARRHRSGEPPLSRRRTGHGGGPVSGFADLSTQQSTAAEGGHRDRARPAEGKGVANS